MGYDRVRFYDGIDSPSTLISADKQSHGTVVSRDFRSFLGIVGFRATLGVDWSNSSEVNAKMVARGAKPIPFPPAEKTKDWYHSRNIADIVVKVEPPIEPEAMKLIMRYLDVYCDPTDAGPLYLDHRGTHNGCEMSKATGLAPCVDPKPKSDYTI